jgi:TFIIB zinc-binding protein
MKALSNVEGSVCGSTQIVTIPDSSEIVCEHCGSVISDKIEEKGPEWRSFTTATAGREESGGRAQTGGERRPLILIERLLKIEWYLRNQYPQY